MKYFLIYTYPDGDLDIADNMFQGFRNDILIFDGISKYYAINFVMWEKVNWEFATQITHLIEFNLVLVRDFERNTLLLAAKQLVKEGFDLYWKELWPETIDKCYPPKQRWQSMQEIN